MRLRVLPTQLVVRLFDRDDLNDADTFLGHLASERGARDREGVGHTQVQHTRMTLSLSHTHTLTHTHTHTHTEVLILRTTGR